MNRILIALVMSALSCLCSVAQYASEYYEVASFDIDPTNLQARTEPRIDSNGRVCALLKVYVKDRVTRAAGNVVGDVIDHGMEKLVYMTHDAKAVELQFAEHMPLRINFDDHNYASLTGKMVYTVHLREVAPAAVAQASAPTPTVDLQLPTGTINVGDTFTLSVNINNPNGQISMVEPSLAGCDFKSGPNTKTASSVTTYSYTYLACTDGTVRVPAIPVKVGSGTYTTPAASFTVAAALAAEQATQPFIKPREEPAAPADTTQYECERLGGHIKGRDFDLCATNGNHTHFFTEAEWDNLPNKGAWTKEGIYLQSFVVELTDKSPVMTWYDASKYSLPTKDQLEIIAKNKKRLNSAFITFGGRKMYTEDGEYPSYWTSSEDGATNASYILMNTGKVNTTNKGYICNVRQVAPVATECAFAAAPAATFTSTDSGERITVNGVSFDMVRVPGGTFQMGGDQYDDEKPIHSVTVSSFSIGKTEVTQALWKAVMGNNPSNFRGDNLPVERVSWDDCQEFIRKLNALTGRHYRLPTEAEWEFASRGGNHSNGYEYSGSDNLDSVAWYTDNSGGTTHAVGTKTANELGLYDMSGNVWEWTSDLWSSDYNSPRNGGSRGYLRVHRGGSWSGSAVYCRSALRNNDSHSIRYNFLGFRLAH